MSEPQDPALDAAIAAAPDDPAGYQVLADWLEERGHQRARLIRTQLTEQNVQPPGRMFRAIMLKHGAALVDPALENANLTWRYGFVRTAAMHDPAAVAAIFAHPCARFLEELEIALYDGPAVEGIAGRTAELIAALRAAAPRPTLRRLTLQFSHGGFVDLDGTGHILAPVEHLKLGGAWEFAGLEAPSATEVDVRTFSTPRSYHAIARGRWTHLRTLEVSLGDLTTEGAAALAPLFQRGDLPALRRLGLDRAPDPVQLCRWLVAAPFAAQLDDLDLQGAMLTDEAAELLLTSNALPSLRRLRLGAHRLSSAMQARFAQELPAVSLAGYQFADPANPLPDDDDERYDEEEE
jgi:uncharacterized protein (TIGR02996 family)